MASNQIEFGRLVEYGPDSNSSILQFPNHRLISTDNVYGGTTDSAAAAIAIATGYKTENYRIGQNASGQAVPTILELAEQEGYVTGIVVTCQVNHATPASFAAHNSDCNNYVAIAADIADAGVDLLLGGGSSNAYFGTQVANLQALGYTYVTTSAALSGAATIPVLGLFTADTLPYERDRTAGNTVPTLTEMVAKGIALLNSSGKPFVLVVEGSQIDWGGHYNDKVILAHEVIEFERAVNYTKVIAEQNDNYQVLVCGDHETGGFSISSFNFVTELPSENDPLAMKIQKRTNRANEVSVAFTTTGHTSTQVYLAGMGPYTNQIAQASHHVDTFQIMRQAIETLPDTGCDETPPDEPHNHPPTHPGPPPNHPSPPPNHPGPPPNHPSPPNPPSHLLVDDALGNENETPESPGTWGIVSTIGIAYVVLSIFIVRRRRARPPSP